jgi:ubiquinone/menaquinone biosynthesis C-methylase UbiE
MKMNMSATRAVGISNGSTRELWIKQVLSDLPAGAHLLDAGAGECQYKKYCNHLHYVSQDIAVYEGCGETGLHTGKWNTSKIDIICDITTVPLPDASFDAILCSEVLEHLPDPIPALREMARLLKPGGVFIGTSPFWSLTHFAPTITRPASTATSMSIISNALGLRSPK